MSKELSPSQKELYQRVDEVLHYLWDPCQAKDVPAARDEYHAYLPQVFSRLIANAGKDAIVDYLVSVERDQMGMEPATDHAGKIADILLAHQEWIAEKAK